ncbi:GrpB family protein [Bifidobacterium bohemicum]
MSRHTCRPSLRRGFVLDIREPWWYGHRMLRLEEPACNLHVWSLGAPEATRHRIFRDWLRGNEANRELYAAVKCGSVSTDGRRELVSRYNERKQETVRLIYSRAFIASGLIDPNTLPCDEFAFPCLCVTVWSPPF